MKIIKNHLIEGSAGKPILVDVFWNEKPRRKPIVVFCHGYKGYKDWGAWELVAKTFAEAGVLFVKFNFSYNGGSKDNPIDFPDLDAFGKNTYTIERNDLGKVIDWIMVTKLLPKKNVDLSNLTVIGHSRGGGIALLQAGKDKRVKKVITWAAISDIGARFPQGAALEKWKIDGVRYVRNGRTLQDMPHEYGFYEDYIQNQKDLNILEVTRSMNEKPLLIIHGKDDEAVNPSEARAIHHANINSQLKIIPNTGHTFGSKHPWKDDELPLALKEVVDMSIEFVK